MMSSVYGQFNNFYGTLVMNNDNIKSISGTVNVSTVFTNNEKRDAHLKSDDFFNVDKYPEISFKCDQVRPVDNGYVAIGKLQIHGISKIVTIPFKKKGSIIDSSGRQRFALTGGLTINRKDYGISYSKKMDNGGFVVDDYVDIELSIHVIEAIKNTYAKES